MFSPEPMNAPKPESTRERLIAVATELFAAKGYNATSVADLLRAADANAGSLYHFFPTKQDVLIEVLRRYRDGIYPMLLDPLWEGVDDPVARVFALLGGYRRMLADSDCFYGCPIGNLALELHEPDPPVRRLLSENFENWTAAVRTCLDAAGARLPADCDRGKLAVFVLTTMEGGVMLARTHRNIAHFDAGVAMLRDYFDRLEREAREAGTRGKGG